MSTSHDALHALADAAQACHLCPAMSGRRRVLSEANGSAAAPIMVVAEAPGRLGAEVTGVPLSGDASGQRFEMLLKEAGLDRAALFITNAVLCNPRHESGGNRTPTALEVRTCSTWLAAQVALVDPALVVTLGARALAALGLIEAHRYRLHNDVGRLLMWQDRLLMPLYHPSPRTAMTRPWSTQRSDFRRLGTAVTEHDLGRRRQAPVNCPTNDAPLR